MDAARRILKLLAICCLCNMASHAQPTGTVGGPDDGEGLGVTMEITELDVNDSTLTLRYNTRNGSDRDAWVCTSPHISSGSVNPADGRSHDRM